MKRLLVVLTVLAACSHRAASSAGPAAVGPTGGAAPAAGVTPAELSPEQIRLVQRSLVDRGFAVDPTGTYDDRTRSALTDFRRARGLPPTAALDRPTLDALGIDPHDVMPPQREGLGSGPREDHDHPLPGVEPYSPSDPAHPDSRDDAGRGGGADR